MDGAKPYASRNEINLRLAALKVARVLDVKAELFDTNLKREKNKYEIYFWIPNTNGDNNL